MTKFKLGMAALAAAALAFGVAACGQTTTVEEDPAATEEAAAPAEAPAEAPADPAAADPAAAPADGTTPPATTP
jgi:translation initiation factor IF-2